MLLIGKEYVDFRFEVAITGEQVEAAVQVVVKKEQPKFEPQQARTFDSFYVGLISEKQLIFLFAEQSIGFIGEVADDQCEFIGTNLAPVDTHGAAYLPFGAGDIDFRPFLDKLAIALVVEKE